MKKQILLNVEVLEERIAPDSYPRVFLARATVTLAMRCPTVPSRSPAAIPPTPTVDTLNQGTDCSGPGW